MIIPAVEPVAFSIFGIPVYWYGITMASSILVVFMLANKLFNQNNPDKKDLILSVAPILILLGVLGARLYFCLVNFGYYFVHPLEILDIRQGGLSIHGALIVGILSLIVISLKYKISKFKILDAFASATILGQSIGRWGNYFNSEAYGFPVLGQNWGLYIPLNNRFSQFVQYDLFHPTFLYESVLDLFGFVFLLFIYRRCANKKEGITFFAYLIVYSIIRFIVECFRIDSALNIGLIPLAQVVSVILFFIGLVGVIYINLNNKKAG